MVLPVVRGNLFYVSQLDPHLAFESFFRLQLPSDDVAHQVLARLPLSPINLTWLLSGN